MIKAEQFHAAFGAGLHAACPLAASLRRPGRTSQYRAPTPAGNVDINFKVNGKASAIPYQPGAFWPVVQTSLRHNARDDGLVSWYQYTDAAVLQDMLDQQKAVLHKVAGQTDIEPPFWASLRDACILTMREQIAMGFAVGFPHSSLHYLDAADAEAWGQLIGRALPAWLERFCAAPETLEAYMWRVHWQD